MEDCAYNEHNSQTAETLDPPPDYLSPVHCVRVSNDGLVYVCDRSHNRIQVFKTDGTYVNEVFLDRDADARTSWDFEAKKPIPFTGKGRGAGAASNVTLSRDPENTYLFVGGSPSYRRLYILERKTLRLLDTLEWVTDAHELAVDSQFNIYTVAAWDRTVSKLVFKGMRPLE